MTPPHAPAVPPPDPVPTPNYGTSANDITNMTLSSAPPAPDHIATSQYWHSGQELYQFFRKKSRKTKVLEP